MGVRIYYRDKTDKNFVDDSYKHFTLLTHITRVSISILLQSAQYDDNPV